MQLCQQCLAFICAGRLQSILAKTCSRFARNFCHPYFALVGLLLSGRRRQNAKIRRYLTVAYPLRRSAGQALRMP